MCDAVVFVPVPVGSLTVFDYSGQYRTTRTVQQYMIYRATEQTLARPLIG